MLIQLTYASRSSRPVQREDVEHIINASKRNNPRLGITGALCWANGIFLQQLEGDRTAVNTLYRRIMADDRHRESIILDMAEISHRRFASWSMGLLTENKENRAIFLKYSGSAEFDPFSMRSATLSQFFGDIIQHVKWLDNATGN